MPRPDRDAITPEEKTMFEQKFEDEVLKRPIPLVFKVKKKYAKDNSNHKKFCDECFRIFDSDEAYLVVYFNETKRASRGVYHRVCEGCHENFAMENPWSAKVLDYQGYFNYE